MAPGDGNPKGTHMARKSERSRRNRELENKTRQVKKTPKPDDAAPMSAEVVTPHKTLSPNKKNYRTLLWIVLSIVIVIVGFMATLRGLESARDEIRERAVERHLVMLEMAIAEVYDAGIQPDAATVRQEYYSSVSFDDLMRNCVFRWSALPDVQPPPPSGELDDIWRKFKAFRRKQKHIVVAYERRFELESYEGEIIVLLLSGEVKRLKKEQLAALLESQPIDTSDQPVTSPQ